MFESDSLRTTTCTVQSFFYYIFEKSELILMVSCSPNKAGWTKRSQLFKNLTLVPNDTHGSLVP
jgi:hypothetical protein